MIVTRIVGNDFKGTSFDQEINNKTIFLGNNGSGKSRHLQALTLALLGYIPGSSKLNEEILTNFGTSDLLSVGFELDKTLFQRAWQRVPAGSVKELFQISRKRCTKDAYLQALGEKGIPKVLDLSLFLNLSDQKKIDMLLTLYPSETDLAGLETMIENQKKSILVLEDKARSTEKAAAALTASRATMALPAGSLAETTANIEKAEKDLATAQVELSTIVSANAAEKAKVEAEEKAEADKKKDALRAEAEAAALKKKQDLAAKVLEEAHKAELGKAAEKIKELEKVKDVPLEPKGTFEEWSQEGFKVILQNIISTMDAAGCTVCAAKMVCKKELKKYGRQ